jgi:hypothetical protein
LASIILVVVEHVFLCWFGICPADVNKYARQLLCWMEIMSWHRLPKTLTRHYVLAPAA